MRFTQNTYLCSLGCILIVFCLCTQTVVPCCFFHVLLVRCVFLMHGNFKNASWDLMSLCRWAVKAMDMIYAGPHLAQNGAGGRVRKKKLHFYSISLFILIYSVGYPAVDFINWISFIYSYLKMCIWFERGHCNTPSRLQASKAFFPSYGYSLKFSAT